VAVARVFGTHDQYGDEPRARPPRMPLILPSIGRPQVRACIDFGPVPPEVVEAERIRRAIGRATLTSLFGNDRPGMTLQEKVDDIYPTISADGAFGDFNWYATFLLEETLELTVSEIAPWDFIIPEGPLERAEEIARPDKARRQLRPLGGEAACSEAQNIASRSSSRRARPAFLGSRAFDLGKHSRIAAATRGCLALKHAYLKCRIRRAGPKAPCEEQLPRVRQELLLQTDGRGRCGASA
jgi:hypothetical protein